MIENPYQTPETGLTDPKDYLTEHDFEIGEALRQAWEATWSSVGAWLPAFVIGFVLIVASVVTVIGYFLLIPVFMWGFVLLLINMIDGRAELADIFGGFLVYGKALGRMLLLGLLFLVIGLICNAPAYVGMAIDSQALTVTGQIVGVILNVIISMRLYFAAFLVVDRDLPAVEALGKSWDTTKGKGLKIFLMVLMCFPILILGMLLFLVGILPATAIAYGMFASAYRQMFPQPSTNAQ